MFATQWFNDTMNLEMYLIYYTSYKIFEGFLYELFYMVPKGMNPTHFVGSCKGFIFHIESHQEADVTEPQEGEEKKKEWVTCLHDHSLAVLGCRAGVAAPTAMTCRLSSSHDLGGEER